MLTSELVTLILEKGYDIQDTTTSPTTQTTKTSERIQRSLQAGCEIIRNAYDWPWNKATSTGTVSSYTCSLPATFQSFGPRCTIYRVTDGRELRRRPLSELTRQRYTNPATGKPELWAYSTLGNIAIYPDGTGETSLTFANFNETCPELDYTAGATDDELESAVPAYMHRQILFDYAVIDLKLMGGDENYLPMRLEWEKRLRQAWADENLMPGANRVPRYGRGSLRP